MGKLLALLALLFTSVVAAAGAASSAPPADATGVTMTLVSTTHTPASTRRRGTIVDFEANEGPAIVRVASSDGTGRRAPLGPVVVRLDGERLVGPLDLRRAGGELEIPVELTAGTNRLRVRVLGHPAASVDVEVVQHLSASVAVDTVWAGHVLVGDAVVVQPDAVLTVLPGTTVAFEHYRGYREPDRRLGLTVLGGIVAVGDPLAPISFTSDAADPRNGDWAMVRLETPSGPTIFDHVVFEFAQQGLNVWQGDDVQIAHAVFRWNNWEGLYFESDSRADIEHCAIYENGYNGMAAEQFNILELESCEVWRNGTNGIHVDASTVEIRRSLVHDNLASGLSVDDNGELTALGVASTDNGGSGIAFGGGTNVVAVGNVDVSGNAEGGITGPYTVVPTSYTIPSAVSVGFTPDDSNALGYVPGDPLLDEYLYVYPDDETRTIVAEIGEGLGLTWSLAWDGDHLWTATVTGDVYELDPVTGDVLSTFPAPGPQPWGMTFDGTHLWVVDFAEQRISKVDPVSGAELASYATPDPDGGAKGVTWVDPYLYVMGWTSPTIYRMTTDGVPAGEIELAEGGGGITWDGSSFWVPGGPGILRYDPSGNVIGWIYAASEGTWDLTWDGSLLWATQRTNENWQDAKIFALDVHPQAVP